VAGVHRIGQIYGEHNVYIRRPRPADQIIEQMILALSLDERAELDTMEMTTEEAETIIREAVETWGG
jgi:hypothetical protein